MSILRNANVACLCRLRFPLSPVDFKHCQCPMSLFFGPHVAVAKGHVALWNLRNGHVALSILGVKGHHLGYTYISPPPPSVFEIKVLFCAPLGCIRIKTVRPGIFLGTPLVYCNENWVKKCAHIGRTRPKNVRPAAEMCAPGAECTLNFQHCPYIHTTYHPLPLHGYFVYISDDKTGLYY